MDKTRLFRSELIPERFLNVSPQGVK